MSDTLKILAAGDFHGNTKTAEALAEKAERENVDLVVLCGDLTHAEMSTVGLLGPFAKINKKVLLIPGNHESVATADFLAETYNATNLHVASAVYKDVGFFGCGGSANVGPMPPTTESEIFNNLVLGNSYLKEVRKRIMVTHMHPEGILAQHFSHPVVKPSSGVAQAVKELQPDILLCCHVHEAEGIEEKLHNTLVINVGRKGKILEL